MFLYGTVAAVRLCQRTAEQDDTPLHAPTLKFDQPIPPATIPAAAESLPVAKFYLLPAPAATCGFLRITPVTDIALAVVEGGDAA
jgi:hypothetical protein